MKLIRGSEKNIGSMVLRGTARLIGGRVTRMMITLVGIAVLARLLTPADFGVFAVAAMILPLANALLEGLIDVPTIREDELDLAGLANLIWVGVMLMVGLATALWFLAPDFALLLNSPQLAEVLRVLCFGLLLQPFIAASNALLRREHRFGVSALFMPISGAAYVLSATGLALSGFGVWSLILGQIASLVITAVGLTLLSGIPLLPPRRLQTGAAWRLGGVGLTTRLLAWMSANIDTLFASAALGAAGAGMYSRAYNLTTQIKSPFEAFEQTIRQAFVAQRSLDDAAASRATLKGLRLVTIVAALVSATLIVLREPVVALLLGPQWSPIILPLSVLAASLPARVARLYLDGFTYARGSMRFMLARNIAIIILLTIGLWLWANEGITEIALIVAAVHGITLLFRGGAIDISIAGTISQRFSAIAPGYLIGTAMIVIGELISVVMSIKLEYWDWSVRAIICMTFAICVLMTLPETLLPSSLQKRRKLLF